MTLVGRDKPGLVNALSVLVARYDGNWLESRMTRLGGEFAGIVRIRIPSERESDFLKGIEELEERGLKIVVKRGEEAPAREVVSRAVLEMIGQDRPGIISQISHVLTRHDVNVEELHSECVSAPMSGEILFKARILVGIPAGCDVAELELELERIAGDLMVDIDFEEKADD